MTIDIYTTPQCGFCQQLKKLLEEENMPYTAFDITSDAKALEEMTQLVPGNMSVPVTVLEKGTPDQKVAIGFEEAKKLLQLESVGVTSSAFQEIALLTCPKCGAKQEEKIPTSSCVPSYTCRACQQVIKSEGDNCCVFCNFSDHSCSLKSSSI